jgi:hypothetical protein
MRTEHQIQNLNEAATRSRGREIDVSVFQIHREITSLPKKGPFSILGESSSNNTGKELSCEKNWKAKDIRRLKRRMSQGTLLGAKKSLKN